MRTLALAALMLGMAQGAAAEVADGHDVYLEHCASCHGQNLDDGQFAPSLKGSAFTAKWRSRAALLAFVAGAMPPGQAGSLSPEEYAGAVDHLLQANRPAPGGPAKPR